MMPEMLGLLAMGLGAGGPGPGPKPPLPGTPIKHLPPFVTDTLFPITGGPFDIRRAFAPPDMRPLGPGEQAQTIAPIRPQQGDTAVVFYEDPTAHVLAHEAGHILDNRGTAAPVFAQASTGQDSYRHPEDYFGRSRDEYVAEAFSRALMSARKQFADSTRVDKDMPGTIQFIRWLLKQPLFNQSGEKKP